MKRVLLLDNYDSFTFNLFHLVEALGVAVDVVRNDELDLSVVKGYSHIILSPGPGLPKEAGSMMELIEQVDTKIPILGVCLGMQAIALHLEGEIYNQDQVKHGLQIDVRSKGGDLFHNMPEKFEVGLYHSWAVRRNIGDFIETAESEEGVLMAMENKQRKMHGVQFHPESVMTPKGKTIVRNFLDL